MYVRPAPIPGSGTSKHVCCQQTFRTHYTYVSAVPPDLGKHVLPGFLQQYIATVVTPDCHSHNMDSRKLVRPQTKPKQACVPFHYLCADTASLPSVSRFEMANIQVTTGKRSRRVS